ncbi:SRPBCC domain-containing protein [Amycolatopsis sp. cmx-4-68]|uniref:SRPBCC domain-containing protein n=1 Tax=Amycolatopsis sp. cmx-4-68 TaxID=2790938 RepID=UPI00397E3585
MGGTTAPHADIYWHFGADQLPAWRLFATAEGVQQWGAAASDILMPEEAGQPWRWGRQDGDHYHGVIRQYVPGSRLQLSWNSSRDSAETTLTVRFFETHGHGTDVRLTHSGFGTGIEDRISADGYAHEWRKVLAVMGNILEGRKTVMAHSARVGVALAGGTPEVGCLVRAVHPGTAASESGIVAGDYIRSIDGTPMTDLDEFDEFVDARRAGDVVRVELQDRVLELTLGQAESRVI